MALCSIAIILWKSAIMWSSAVQQKCWRGLTAMPTECAGVWTGGGACGWWIGWRGERITGLLLSAARWLDGRSAWAILWLPRHSCNGYRQVQFILVQHILKSWASSDVPYVRSVFMFVDLLHPDQFYMPIINFRTIRRFDVSGKLILNRRGVDTNCRYTYV